jgi:curli biogenesis system outer membrane secretion channel CsgG
MRTYTSLSVQALAALFLSCICLTPPPAHAEGREPTVDASSTSQSLQKLGQTSARTVITVADVSSQVTEIDIRAATTMLTTALVKSRQFRVMERRGAETTSAIADKAGQGFVFEAIFSEATPSKETSNNGIGLGGFNIGGTSNKDEIGLDVRVQAAATGEIVDAINVRKIVEARSSSLSGTGALLETVAGRLGKSLGGLAPDITQENTRKESMDRALRALIELAVVELSKRRETWSAD